LGATRTSAYYAISPFIATFLSLLIFQEVPSIYYFLGLALMILGAILCANDKPIFNRKGKQF
jgi:drug/metabolite transporter (DMT)-like permease